MMLAAVLVLLVSSIANAQVAFEGAFDVAKDDVNKICMSHRDCSGDHRLWYDYPKCQCACNPKVCPKGWYRGDQCSCYLECDIKEQCDVPTFRWDSVLCDCVLCNTSKPCWNNDPRDPKTCECPDVFCNPPSPCPGNQQWNRDKCICECPNPFATDCINDLYHYNSTGCQCECRNGNKPDKCAKYYTWDSNTCTCKCLQKKCPVGMIWNAKQCKCVCKTVGKCETDQIWDENTCQCKCREPCQTCVQPQAWSNATCDCRCSKEALAQKNTCDKKLKYWNEQECQCSCYNKPRECCDGRIWDDKICDCKCKYSCKCAPGYTWNPYTCNCECNAKKDCNYDQYERYFDAGSCRCLCESAKYSRCIAGFNHETCSCRPDQCLGKCPAGNSWDGDFCTCIAPAVCNPA